MPERRASCSCGQLTVTCEGDPVRVSICHCLACQKRTGSAFGEQARFPSSQVRAIEGRSNTFVRIGDSGGRITHRFCPECGSTVCWEISTIPDHIVIAVGAFADPSFPSPTFSVYETRKHGWVRLPEAGMEHWD
jgi:hypothetical protein